MSVYIIHMYICIYMYIHIFMYANAYVSICIFIFFTHDLYGDTCIYISYDKLSSKYILRIYVFVCMLAFVYVHIYNVAVYIFQLCFYILT
jgi:hypothetical protein